MEKSNLFKQEIRTGGRVVYHLFFPFSKNTNNQDKAGLLEPEADTATCSTALTLALTSYPCSALPSL